MIRTINILFKFMRSLYDWTLHWSNSKNSNYALFGIAFAESLFFPIPPDILLIPMVISKPKAWYKKALICTVGSVCGALLGYYIGKIFYDTAGMVIVNFYNLHNVVAVIGDKYTNNAFLSVFGGAFTLLIPYKTVTITAGVFKIPLLVFIVASLVGRGCRFFIVAVTLRIFGKKIQCVIEKYFNVISLLFFVLLAVGFLTLKYLV